MKGVFSWGWVENRFQNLMTIMVIATNCKWSCNCWWPFVFGYHIWPSKMLIVSVFCREDWKKSWRSGRNSKMGLWNLFVSASVPVLNLLRTIAVGSFLATDRVGILDEETRKRLNLVVHATKYHSHFHSWFDAGVGCDPNYKNSFPFERSCLRLLFCWRFGVYANHYHSSNL